MARHYLNEWVSGWLIYLIDSFKTAYSFRNGVRNCFHSVSSLGTTHDLRNIALSRYSLKTPSFMHERPMMHADKDFSGDLFHPGQILRRWVEVKQWKIPSLICIGERQSCCRWSGLPLFWHRKDTPLVLGANKFRAMLSTVVAQGYLCLTLANLPEPNLNPFRSTPISPSGLFKEGLDAFQCWGCSADQCSKLHYQGLGHLPDYHQPRRWPQQHLWGPVLGRLGRHTHSLNSRQGREKESAPDERCRKGLGSPVSSLL